LNLNQPAHINSNTIPKIIMKPKLIISLSHTRSLRRRASALTLISLSLAFSQSVQATSAWWDGGGANTLWSNTTNWDTAANGAGGDPGSVPTTAETATFNATTFGTLGNGTLTVTLDAALSIGGMVFNNTGTSTILTDSVANRIITLGSGGITVNPNAGDVTFGLTTNTDRIGYILGAPQPWTNNGSGILNFVSGTSGGITNGGNLLTLDGSGAIRFAGVISGAGGLTKNGAGTLTLTAANTYSGTTTLTNGILQIVENGIGLVGSITSSTVGTGALVLNGGTISSNTGAVRTILNAVTIGGNVTLGNATNSGALTFSANTDLGGGTRTLTTDSNATFSTGVVDNGGIIKAGSATLTLSGANTYTGGTTITSGTLSVGASNNLGGGASNLVFDGGTLRITGTALTNFSSIGHTVSFNANKTVGLDIDTGAHTFTADQVLNQGTGGLTKLGGGTLVLDQANTYSGVTTITGGQVNITAANNLGDGSATNSITLNSGTLALTAGTVDLGTNRAITLLANSEVKADSAAQLTLSGLISGSFKLTVIGEGTTILSNPNNSFTDLTLGNNGTSPVVQVSSIANAGIASPLGSGSQIRIGAGDRDPVLRLVGSAAPQTTDRTIGVSSGAGGNGSATIANDNIDPNNSLTFTASAFNFQTTSTGGGKTLILAGSNTGNNAINGVIQDNTAAVVRLTKDGTGTWSLFGNNTYTGNTLVNAGTLVLADNAQLKFITGATSAAGQNVLSGAGTVTLNGDFVIDTSATDATALTSGSWVIENADSLPGAYGGTFTVVGWTNAGSDTWTKTVGSKNYTFNELDGTVSMVEVSGDAYTTWIDGFTPNVLLPDAASKLPGADPDGDDFSNLMEFVLDGSPVVSSQSIRPNQTVNATDIILTFKRSDASETPATTQMVQISTDLVDWTTISAITIGAGDNLPSVGVAENGAAADDITVTIPRSGSLKKFVRLHVVK
jgi:trimeric autotransporter adhesin